MKEKGKRKKGVTESDFKEALIKKALGYDATEIVEEYVSGEEGEIKLSKKKVTKKELHDAIIALQENYANLNSELESSKKEFAESIANLKKYLNQYQEITDKKFFLSWIGGGVGIVVAIILAIVL